MCLSSEPWGIWRGWRFLRLGRRARTYHALHPPGMWQNMLWVPCQCLMPKLSLKALSWAVRPSQGGQTPNPSAVLITTGPRRGCLPRPDLTFLSGFVFQDYGGKVQNDNDASTERISMSEPSSKAGSKKIFWLVIFTALATFSVCLTQSVQKVRS